VTVRYEGIFFIEEAKESEEEEVGKKKRIRLL
jgi:hypothetical protein